MSNVQPLVEGFVASGYEPVRAKFEEHVRNGVEEHAQVACYVKGQCVLDLWTKGHQFGLQNIFSSTKVITSLVVAILVDQGHLRYDQLVTDVWPEYGQHGKEGTTVEQVMRHEAGLPKFDTTLNAVDLYASALRDKNKNTVANIISKQQPSYLDVSSGKSERLQREYHSLTRGWIINEIVKRADLQGRTIGQFLSDEITKPLNIDSQVMIGFTEQKYNRLKHLIQPLKVTSFWWTWFQLLLPTIAGGQKVPIRSFILRMILILTMPVGKVLSEIGMLNTLIKRVLTPMLTFFTITNQKRTRTKRTTHAPERALTTTVYLNTKNTHKEDYTICNLFNSEEVRRSECPSANGHATARGLAKIAGTIVEGGQLPNEHRIISEAGLKLAHANVIKRSMFVKYAMFQFNNAGWNLFKNQGRKGYVGWMGLGGSVMQWHPELSIGFGYAMNLLEITPSNERADCLQEIVVQCVRKNQKKERIAKY